jgi:hypothetical protein
VLIAGSRARRERESRVGAIFGLTATQIGAAGVPRWDANKLLGGGILSLRKKSAFDRRRVRAWRTIVAAAPDLARPCHSVWIMNSSTAGCITQPEQMFPIAADRNWPSRASVSWEVLSHGSSAQGPAPSLMTRLKCEAWSSPYSRPAGMTRRCGRPHHLRLSAGQGEHPRSNSFGKKQRPLRIEVHEAPAPGILTTDNMVVTLREINIAKNSAPRIGSGAEDTDSGLR